MKRLQECLQELVGPTIANETIQIIEDWKKMLTTLVPDSYVETAKKITTESSVLFIWYFDNVLSNSHKQSGKVHFYADGSVEFNTQSDTHIQSFETYEEAEQYFLDYFTFNPQPAPKAVLGELPSISDRQKNFSSWMEIMETLKKYKVDVEVRDGEQKDIFAVWLPTLEKVLTEDGYSEEGAIYFEPGGDWSKILKEEVIEPLKELYALSKTEVPDFNQELSQLELGDDAKKLTDNLNSWVGWLEKLAKKSPFKIKVEDVYSTLSYKNYYFDGKEVYTKQRKEEGECGGIMEVTFGHSYVFNGSKVPITLFSGSLIYFENNQALLKFSGVPIPADHRDSIMWKAWEDGSFMYDSMYVKNSASEEPQKARIRDYMQYTKPLTLIGNWETVSFKFGQVIAFINAFMGEDIKRFSAIEA